MHHNQGNTYLSDADFVAVVWRMFPQGMKDWMTIEQRTDPFDSTNPMDEAEICDFMYGYWFTHLQPSKKKKSDDDSSKRKRDGGGDGDGRDGGSGKRHRGDRRGERGGGGGRGGGRGGQRGGRGGRGGGSERAKCAIPEHETHQHKWWDCFLNPRSANFDADAAKDYYENGAKGRSAWYKDTYDRNCNGGRGGGGGRGYDNRSGRGGYQGRGGGYQGGRGGSGRGYQGRGYQGRGGGGGRGGYHDRQQSGGGSYHYHRDEGEYHQGYDEGGYGEHEHYHYGSASYAQAAPPAPAAPRVSSYAAPQRGTSYGRGAGRGM